MAKGKRPVPFRTRKLCPSAPMVLRARVRGRVGRRRTFFFEGRRRAAFGISTNGRAMPPRRRQEQRQPTPAARPRRSTKPSRKVPAKVAAKPSESALTPPPDADPAALDPGVRAELRALPAGLAERVASHLAATAMLIDED